MKEEINTTLILLEKHYLEKRSNKVRKALKYKRLRLFILFCIRFAYGLLKIHIFRKLNS